MIHIGAQYYRPPFPLDTYWEDDLKLMADTGLNAVQLWVVWGWVEATPGAYDFSDYQRIVDSAERHGLDVVLSTIAAIHPYWIHDEEPGSEMINNVGQKIVFVGVASGFSGAVRPAFLAGKEIDAPKDAFRRSMCLRLNVQNVKPVDAAIDADAGTHIVG